MIRGHGIEVTFNAMMSLLNFMKMYQLVQKLLVADTQTNGGTDRMVILYLTLLSEEIWLITNIR
jgi:hypothetical protein